MHDLETIVRQNEIYPIKLDITPRRKPTADLSKWMISGRNTASSLPDGFMIAYGQISNDEAGRFQDGLEIRTSQVLRVDVQLMQIETLNTIYNLK